MIVLKFKQIELTIYKLISGKRNLNQIFNLLQLINNAVFYFLEFLKNKSAYNFFKIKHTSLKITGYINDYIKYKNFIDNHRNNVNIKLFINFNNNLPIPSSAPFNSFYSSLTIIDMVYFVNKKESLNFNKITTFNNATSEKNNIDCKNLKIGVFSSSSGIAFNYQDRVKKTKHLFEEVGIDIFLGDLWNKKDHYVSGTITNRAKEFNDLLNKSNILMSMIGGYNSSSILSFIDYQKIEKDKIKIVGFSDTTAILLAVYKKTNIPTYYGPAFLPSFLENNYIKEWNFNLFKDIIIDNKNIELFNPDFYTDDRIDWSLSNTEEYAKVMKKNKVLSFNPAIIEGRLIGGNLNTMVSIYNTEFMPEIIEGDILFIEDSYKRADECERNFAFLKNSKILEKISGLIIGKCEHFDNQGANITYHELLLKFIDRKIPIIANYDCSHTLPMNILKIGGWIKLDAIKKTITLLN